MPTAQLGETSQVGYRAGRAAGSRVEDTFRADELQDQLRGSPGLNC
jgi:hypothetical protein